MARPELKREILRFLANRGWTAAREVVARFDDLRAQEVRRAVRELIDAGELDVSTDWKVRATKGKR